MKKLKNVGAGPVSAQKEVIDNCPDFLKRSKQKNIECSSVHSNFNGITLIALIITILFSYDEMIKFSNSKGFLLATI